MTVGHAIGGYFGPDLAGTGRAWPPRAESIGLQSARAAIAAFFPASRATAVWAPFFLCGAVRDALEHAGAQVIGYALDPRRGVAGDVVLGPGEWLLCVDYFGLSGDACDA